MTFHKMGLQSHGNSLSMHFDTPNSPYAHLPPQFVLIRFILVGTSVTEEKRWTWGFLAGSGIQIPHYGTNPHLKDSLSQPRFGNSFR